MTVFKRRAGGLIKSLAIAFGSGTALGVLVFVFTDRLWLGVIIGSALLGVLLFMALFSENIRVEIGEGRLRYFVRGACKHDLALAACQANYRIKSSNGSTDSILLWLTPEGSDAVCLDCDPLGQRQFLALWALIEQAGAAAPPQKLEVKE